MRICSNCGREAPDNTSFCGSCGGAVVERTGQKTNNIEQPGPINPSHGYIPINTPDQGINAGNGDIKNAFGIGKKVIIGALVTLFILAGGFWGWQNLGTEARTQAKLDLAVKYVSENNFEKAILAYNEAINIDPKEAKAYQGLARVYTLQCKYDEAKSTYDRGLTAVKADQLNTLRLGLAGMYIDQNQLTNAEKAFLDIKNANQSCLEAYWGLAMVYQKKGDNARAEALLREAVQQNPNEYRAYNTLALYLKQKGKTGETLNTLVKSVALETNQQEAYLILSELYKGKWAELRANLSGISNRQVAEMLEFYSYYAAGDYQKAAGFYKSKLSNQPTSHQARILYAIVMLKTGDRGGAENLINQLLGEKLNEWLLGDVAEYYFEAGNKDKAKEYAIKALQSNGSNLDAIAILQNLNSGDSAVKTYAACYLLYNWNPVGKARETLQARALPVPSDTPAAGTASSNSGGTYVYGNSPGNVANMGSAAQDEEWVYFILNGNIYKEKKDGGSRTKLTDDYAQELNVDRDWIYYRNNKEDSKLYKIKKDGSSRTKLTDERIQNISLVNGWLYYWTPTGSDRICKINTDGTRWVQITDDRPMYVNVVGDWIYYSNGNDNSKIYRVRTDGTERTKVADDYPFMMNVVGDWIYYGFDSGHLHKVRTDGTGRTKLNDDYCLYINATEDWIYYANQNDNVSLYRIRSDGTGRQKLNNEYTSGISVIGDWIYYHNGDEGHRLYKMKTDGSQRQAV